MEHVAAFMLLVGCTGDNSVCREIPVPVPAYETVAQCESDLPIQQRMSGSQADRLYGACTPVTPDVFERSASIDWQISRDGRLMVSFDAEPQLVAAR